jgi:16S rRNA (cytidine1402-2'-O)-methyltransferase
MKKGKLYLIPSPLGESHPDAVFPPGNSILIGRLDCFIVEEVRTARRFLKKICPEINIDALTFIPYNEHSSDADVSACIVPILQGRDAGIISEAGTPCVADPGSKIVAHAHSSGIQVIPLVGPSSLLLALMASGFNGQNFVFHGYLPIEKPARTRKIKEIETEMMKKNQTQVFIETPYRNLQLFQAIVETCQDATLLCIATSLTTAEESILTLPVREWKKRKPGIHKQPVVFLIYH